MIDMFIRVWVYWMGKGSECLRAVWGGGIDDVKGLACRSCLMQGNRVGQCVVVRSVKLNMYSRGK